MTGRTESGWLRGFFCSLGWHDMERVEEENLYDENGDDCGYQTLDRCQCCGAERTGG